MPAADPLERRPDDREAFAHDVRSKATDAPITIAIRLDSLASAIDSLGLALGVLHERIEPVLNPSDPSAVPSSPTEELTSDVALKIARLQERVVLDTHRIAALSQRVDL